MRKAAFALLLLAGCNLRAGLYPEEVKQEKLEGHKVYYFEHIGERHPDLDQMVHANFDCIQLRNQIRLWMLDNQLNIAQDINYEAMSKSVAIHDGKPDFKGRFCPLCIPDPF